MSISTGARLTSQRNIRQRFFWWFVLLLPSLVWYLVSWTENIWFVLWGPLLRFGLVNVEQTLWFVWRKKLDFGEDWKIENAQLLLKWINNAKKLPYSPDFNLIIHIKKCRGTHILKDFYHNLPNCTLIIQIFKVIFDVYWGYKLTLMESIQDKHILFQAVE